ncbi:MAG TPA: crosslink repair DNA glycosylase YcaQ family protein, partial [Bryobacteraceae bacterium]|nr:crosslink repair DNA glycosylase YcaQ family protein [Bryobacteraceae bacterium]
MSTVPAEKLRAWYSHRQGLDGRLAGASAAEVLTETGWARSVGGTGPYLTLFSRAGISREAADAAVAKLEIHELPSARGCTYVLPSQDFALALKAGENFTGNDMKVALKLGVTEKEVDKLCDAVVKALAKGTPMEVEQIREGVGNAARSLGEEGKKKGVTTTLPLALGMLQ